MSQNMNLQERYSKLVDAKLRQESIFEKLFNHRHEGDPKAGAVKIPYRAEATVGAYDIANGGTLTNPSTSYTTLVTDNDIYVNELIDHYVAAAVPDGLIAERLDSAGFAMADDIDVDLAALCVSGGTAQTGSGTASTAATIYNNMVDAVQTAKALKVKRQEMWFAISNAAYGLLLKSADFQRATTGDIEQWGAGFVGMVGGVPVFETANMPTNTEYILGNSAFCHFVSEWIVPVALNDLADGKHIGASAVQGRKVWGAAISKAATVLYHKSA